MKRLTKRLDEVPECVRLNGLGKLGMICKDYAADNCDCLCDAGCVIGDAFKKLADYEDAEENGSLFRTEFKPGDTAYILEKTKSVLDGSFSWIIEKINILDVSAGGYITDDVDRYIWYNPADGMVFKTEKEATEAMVEEWEKETRGEDEAEDEE